MIPNIDDRLASVVRALTEVILPHLPPEASLAQEQTHLCIGHLQILRAQIDAALTFERGELADSVALGQALQAVAPGDAAALAEALAAADGCEPRQQRMAINQAIEDLVDQSREPALGLTLAPIILEHEHRRVQKDRSWCAPFGFDTI